MMKYLNYDYYNEMLFIQSESELFQKDRFHGMLEVEGANEQNTNNYYEDFIQT